MSRGKMVSLKVTYEDGTCQELDVVDIPDTALAMLEKAGSGPTDTDCQDSSGRYVMVEWKDGWKETYRLPEDVTGLRRYYVIERQESVGRLFFDRKEDYPELVQILRKPQEVEKAYLI